MYAKIPAEIRDNLLERFPEAAKYNSQDMDQYLMYKLFEYAYIQASIAILKKHSELLSDDVRSNIDTYIAERNMPREEFFENHFTLFIVSKFFSFFNGI